MDGDNEDCITKWIFLLDSWFDIVSRNCALGFKFKLYLFMKSQNIDIHGEVVLQERLRNLVLHKTNAYDYYMECHEIVREVVSKELQVQDNVMFDIYTEKTRRYGKYLWEKYDFFSNMSLKGICQFYIRHYLKFKKAEVILDDLLPKFIKDDIFRDKSFQSPTCFLYQRLKTYGKDAARNYLHLEVGDLAPT